MSRSTRPAWPGLAVLGLGASIVPLDFAVNVAFPAITAAFSLPTDAIRWVAVCYVLVYGSLMLGFGALGDRIGYLRVFRAGLALGALAFVLCAMAPAFGWLLAARAVQGVSVGLTLSCAPALATLLVDEHERTRALSAFGSLQAAAGVVAPVIGGAALAWLDWPGVFAFRVPVVLLALAGTPWLAQAAARQVRRTGGGFDAAGSVLLAAAVALLLLGTALVGPGWSPWPALGCVLAGGAAAARFVRRQHGAASPFMPAAVARDPGFRRINAAACLVQLASFAAPLTVPYYLLRGGGWTPMASGLLLAVWAAGMLAGSGAAGRLVPSLGTRRAATLGALLAAAGLVGMALWPERPQAPLMAACLLLQGVGLGLFQVAHADAVVAALPPSSRGVAGSLSMVARTVGVVVGATLWLGLLQAAATHAASTGGEPRAALMTGLGMVFWGATGASLAAAGLAWRARPEVGQPGSAPSVKP
ncbi:MAG: MFS transporter [Burkholderiales bacterium]|nr:MFS transporter [Burkholderiales bacterium]